MIVMRFVGADRVIARPFAIVQALAQRERSFMKWSSNRHGVRAACGSGRLKRFVIGFNNFLVQPSATADGSDSTFVRASDYSYADNNRARTGLERNCPGCLTQSKRDAFAPPIQLQLGPPLDRRFTKEGTLCREHSNSTALLPAQSFRSLFSRAPRTPKRLIQKRSQRRHAMRRKLRTHALK